MPLYFNIIGWRLNGLLPKHIIQSLADRLSCPLWRPHFGGVLFFLGLFYAVSSKDELKVVLQGQEQHFWRGTEAGWLGCYDFPGETWAGDGSV